MTRLILAAAVALVSGQAMAASSSTADNGKCLLVIQGKTYINGPCFIDRRGSSDGVSFSINTRESKTSDPYFLYFNKTEDGGTESSWNADPQSTHAHTSLGEGFKRRGSCWTNNLAKICTWPNRR